MCYTQKYIDEKHDITKPSGTLQTVIVWNQWKMCDNEQESRETQKTQKIMFTDVNSAKEIRAYHIADIEVNTDTLVIWNE